MKQRLFITAIALLFGLQSAMAQTNLSNTTGFWYDPAYDGSGFNMAELSGGLYIYFYGYKSNTVSDDTGEAQWLVTAAGIPTPIAVNQTYEVDLRSGFIGNGATFTDAPTTDGSGTEVWGLLSLTFDSCESGVATLTGNDGQVSHEIIKFAELGGLSCQLNSTDSVDPSKFLASGLAEDISTVSCTLSDGTSSECYKIVTKSMPSDSDMGPWCPEHISDDASAGGIWLEGGEVYDVDGPFIENLASFYNDSSWQMYDSITGQVTKTESVAECEAAANPNVGAEYANYCVECLPEFVDELTDTFYIPVTPYAANTITSFATGPGGPPGSSAVPTERGIAFNGVRFDAPAPLSIILSAYTLAPFDDAGGHINPFAGYHYHAATGQTTEIAQSDGHAPMIGYALDGFGLYANTDVDGNEYTDLDEARGHEDASRGYHYHVDYAGSNNFINGLRGVYAVDGE